MVVVLVTGGNPCVQGLQGESSQSAKTPGSSLPAREIADHAGTSGLGEMARDLPIRPSEPFHCNERQKAKTVAMTFPAEWCIIAARSSLRKRSNVNEW
jgi:hypothetical protein